MTKKTLFIKQFFNLIKECFRLVINFFIIKVKGFLSLFKNLSDPLDGDWIGTSETINLTNMDSGEDISIDVYPSFKLNFTLHKTSPTKFIGTGNMREILNDGLLDEPINLVITGEYSRGTKIISYKSIPVPNGNAYHGTGLLIGIEKSNHTMTGKIIGYRTKSQNISIANMKIKKKGK